MAPRVSWLLPVRDSAQTLGEAVASIAAQSVTDWEAVVVDDGSTDACVASVVRAAVGDDSRFRVVVRPALGIVSALNEGLSLCRGPWVARLDADDRAYPDRLERQLAAVAAGVGVVDGTIRLFSDADTVPEGMAKWSQWLNSLGPEGWYQQRLVDTPVCHPAVLARREAMLSVGGYADGDFPEDFDLWLRLIEAGWRFVRVSDPPVVAVRDRPGRLARTDPRYRREAFDRVRRAHLERTVLQGAKQVAVWGAGKSGRRWGRWLRGRGLGVVYVDPYQVGRQRGESVVLAPSALVQLDLDGLFVAVAARGARPLIREKLCALRPDWQEGADWLFVA